MKLKLVASILLALLLALAVTPVYADDAPSLPHAFYGTVDINGSPAPVGTEVEVRGEGVQTGVGNNPVVTTVEGEYGGGSDPMAPKLIVQGSVTEGDTVTFYVNGFDTGQTAHWRSGPGAKAARPWSCRPLAKRQRSGMDRLCSCSNRPPKA